MELFEFHLRERDRLQEVIQEARREIFAHTQIIEGMARLDAEIMREYRKVIGKGTASADRSSKVPSENQDRTSAPSRTENRPNGIEALKEVLSPHQGQFFSAPEIHELLTQDGLINPGPSSLRVLRNTLSRAVKAGSVDSRQGQDGITYAWKPTIGTEVVIKI
jgi:hypothetical protein